MTKDQLKQLERELWNAADNLRANSDLKSSEYSIPVLGLIFLKFADNNYRRHEAEILAEYQKLKGTRREKKLSDIAIAKCGFYLPDHARYDYLLNLPEEKDIAKALNTSNYTEKRRLRIIVDWMRSVEMAVIVSEEAGEEEKFKNQRLEIKFHRERMNHVDEHGHDVEYNFKDADHPLQLVFVCAMWLTGFDAPTVSTMYLDKPMKDHTLMQTIARANRVTSFKINNVEKKHGELVDYYNVFRNMKEALKNYARGEAGVDAAPVQDKKVLFQLLEDSIVQGTQFCAERDIDLEKILKSNDVFKNVDLFGKYADRILTKDEWRKAFAVYENTITSLFEACKPEIVGNPIVRSVAVFQYLRGVVDSIVERKDIEAVSARISDLLDESVVVDGSTDLEQTKPEFIIKQSGRTWDLSKLDFEKLVAEFKEVITKILRLRICEHSFSKSSTT